MIKRGEKPTRIHNNCSGKHTGFLTVARHWDIATQGYELHDHPVQRAIAKALGELTEIKTEFPWGVDGCAAPNFAVPLDAQARAFAKFAAPDALASERANACRRIVRAMMAYPELVSGTGRTCAILMRSADGRAAVKTGAEGFFAGMIPELGLGIAIKIDDGAGRAADAVIAAILDKLGVLGDAEDARQTLRAPITNTRNDVVGERRVAPTLTEAAIGL
jgi:L-asparaginase II